MKNQSLGAWYATALPSVDIDMRKPRASHFDNHTLGQNAHLCQGDRGLKAWCAAFLACPGKWNVLKLLKIDLAPRGRQCGSVSAQLLLNGGRPDTKACPTRRGPHTPIKCCQRYGLSQKVLPEKRAGQVNVQMLQWGRDQLIAETRIWGLLSSEMAGLQWGRDQLIAETCHAPSRTQSRCGSLQ